MRDYFTLPRGKGKMNLDRIFLPEGNERSFLNTSEREGKKKKIKESLTVCCAGRSERGSQSDSVRKTVFCNKLSFFATPYNAVFCTKRLHRDETARWHGTNVVRWSCQLWRNEREVNVCTLYINYSSLFLEILRFYALFSLCL